MACTACIVVFYLMHSCAYSSLPPLICYYFSLGKTELDLLIMIWLHVMWLYQSIGNCSHNAWRIPPLMCHTIICSFPISCCLCTDVFSFCRHYLFSIVLHVFGQSVNFWAGTSDDYFWIQLRWRREGCSIVFVVLYQHFPSYTAAKSFYHRISTCKHYGCKDTILMAEIWCFGFG